MIINLICTVTNLSPSTASEPKYSKQNSQREQDKGKWEQFWEFEGSLRHGYIMHQEQWDKMVVPSGTRPSLQNKPRQDQQVEW